MITFKQFLSENQKLGDTREWLLDVESVDQTFERYWSRLWAPADDICKHLQNNPETPEQIPGFDKLFDYLGYLVTEVDEGDQIGLQTILKVYEDKHSKGLYVYFPFASSPAEKWAKVAISKDRFLAFLQKGTIWSM